MKCQTFAQSPNFNLKKRWGEAVRFSVRNYEENIGLKLLKCFRYMSLLITQKVYVEQKAQVLQTYGVAALDTI